MPAVGAMLCVLSSLRYCCVYRAWFGCHWRLCYRGCWWWWCGMGAASRKPGVPSVGEVIDAAGGAAGSRWIFAGRQHDIPQVKRGYFSTSVGVFFLSRSAGLRPHCSKAFVSFGRSCFVMLSYRWCHHSRTHCLRNQELKMFDGQEPQTKTFTEAVKITKAHRHDENPRVSKVCRKFLGCSAICQVVENDRVRSGRLLSFCLVFSCTYREKGLYRPSRVHMT